VTCYYNKLQDGIDFESFGLLLKKKKSFGLSEDFCRWKNFVILDLKQDILA